MNNNILAEAVNTVITLLEDTTLELVDDKLYVCNPMNKTFCYYIEQYRDMFTISVAGRMHFANKYTIDGAIHYVETLYICSIKASSPHTKFNFELSSVFGVAVTDDRIKDNSAYYSILYHNENGKVTTTITNERDTIECAEFRTTQKALDFIEARLEEQYKEQK